jgi:hypothetical protein
MLSTDTKTKRQKLRMLLLLTVAAVTMTLLIGGLAEFEFLPGRPFPLAAILQMFGQRGAPFFPSISLPVGVIRLLLACFWLLLLISIIGFIISPEIRRETIKRIIRYTILLLLILGLIQVLQPILRRVGLSGQEGGGVAGLLGEGALESLPSPPDFVVDPPFWFVAGVSLILITLLLLAIWFSWRFIARLKAAEAETPLERLTQEAEQALKSIQAGADLRDTIMRCYFEMNQILKQKRGVQRQQAMTPREFERHLAESGFDNKDIQRLTRLFEHVRYGSKTPEPQAEEEAVACLTAIVQAYSR